LRQYTIGRHALSPSEGVRNGVSCDRKEEGGDLGELKKVVTDKQLATVGELCARAFVEIRSLCREGRAEQAAALADAVHNMPRVVWGWGKWSAALTRSMLEAYEAEYGEQERVFGYVESFDGAFGVQADF